MEIKYYWKRILYALTRRSSAEEGEGTWGTYDRLSASTIFTKRRLPTLDNAAIFNAHCISVNPLAIYLNGSL